MKIETRFNIGDTIYFVGPMNMNRIYSGKITHICIDIQDTLRFIRYSVEYYLGKDKERYTHVVEEEECGTSLANLKEKLISNSIKDIMSKEI